MSRSFLVGQWILGSNNQVRYKRFLYDTYEEALRAYDLVCSMEGTTRAVIRKLGPKRSSSALTVFEKPM